MISAFVWLAIIPLKSENRLIKIDDIDILVSFQDSFPCRLLEFSRMKRELGNLLGRKVDLLTKKSSEQSHNWIRQREILDT